MKEPRFWVQKGTEEVRRLTSAATGSTLNVHAEARRTRRKCERSPRRERRGIQIFMGENGKILREVAEPGWSGEKKE